MYISSFNEYREYLYLEKLHAGRHRFHWPLLRSSEVQGDLTFFGAGRRHFKPFFNSDVRDGHLVRQALRRSLLGQWSAGTTDDFSRHGAVEGWHKEATRWGLGPHARVCSE